MVVGSDGIGSLAGTSSFTQGALTMGFNYGTLGFSNFVGAGNGFSFYSLSPGNNPPNASNPDFVITPSYALTPNNFQAQGIGLFATTAAGSLTGYASPFPYLGVTIGHGFVSAEADFVVPAQGALFEAVDNTGTPTGPAKLTAGTFIESLATPASSSAACVAGTFTDDASYHYVCTATNTWKRAALSTF
jgi:hypothetical protein